ncbi:type I polyketide synthase [Cylindrospermum sp. FACHB-282]|uniref:type I polyketide synthase n=1 Tax=Cylindrospermum sp. FACHB-282 TaxID=2692794 RepID=UPI001688BCD1|nr:type I polyketide synthase [Cylindrospermum sp. FACHB-282]MBD2387201.1 SDR family NAD(P)-dependent oxidoreductase [Cylindrospermum sp. FACHB-282]
MAASRIEAALAQLQNEASNCEKALLKLIKAKKDMSETAMLTSKINRQLQQTNVAIIGMASIFPQSKNLQEYWEKIIQKIDCITDVPPSRWRVEDYYDANPKAPDKTYCKRGGFIPEIDFNPMEFGLPPNILEVTDISQLLGLVVAKSAMEDAGYGESRQFNDQLRDRTGVVLGVAIGRQLAIPLSTRLEYPVWEKVLKSSGVSAEDTQKIIDRLKNSYVQWDENAFPGMLANVIAGRIANRLDFGGMNCVVDAACASSLGALRMAISELVEHRADMMLTGGVDTDNSILAYMCFSKTPAVSQNDKVKPFDADSDGMMLGEGVGMLVLKRLEDAQRDNDRIYAVIKGIGTSSDGRYKSIYAPRPEGQVRALRRAYEDAGFSPASVGLIEAHGTGTMVGDPTEFTSIKEVFAENNPRKQYIALGTVKSQIGHTKAAAGAASLIKAALSLHHKILPPTINVTKPHPKLNIETSPFYLNTETRPWIPTNDQPRRAGVSSFGFGGTNYHVVLEEYENEHSSPYRLHPTPQAVLLFAATPEQLLSRCQEMQRQLQSDGGERHYTELIAACKSLAIPVTNARLGFVANSLTQAGEFLQISIDWLRNKPQAESWEHPQGIYYRKAGLTTQGKVVALFSGQGSQYLEMGRELVMNFPCLRQNYAKMDSLLSKDGLQPVSEVVFPPPMFDAAAKAAQVEALQLTEYAQPAIGVFSAGLYKILQQAGFKADFVAGHSFGELTALWAGGVLSEADYFFLVKARGQAMAAPKDPQFDGGGMLAVTGDVSQVVELIKKFPQVIIANWNSQKQVVLAGAIAQISQVQEALKTQGFSVVRLKVSAAFHTPLVAYAQKPFAQAIEKVTFNTAKIPVYTNVTGGRYPSESLAMQKTLKEHLRNQVLFRQEIENIYGEGGYCFIEFGPKNILTNLVKDILKDKPHIAVALNGNLPRVGDDRTLREAIVQLRVAGLPLSNLDPYEIERQIPEATKHQMLNVRLNSTNYVSEKTKQSFVKALENGHQVDLKSAPLTNVTPNYSPKSPRQSEKVLNGSAKSPQNGYQVDLQLTSINHSNADYPQPSPRQPEKVANGNVKSWQNGKPDYEKVIDSLDFSLTEFSRQQRDILNVHEQSLQYQTEYTKTFLELMQQQHSFLGNGQLVEQQTPTQQLAISSSERSIMRFHDHQTDTLRIHERYLNYQHDYTNNYFQLIQQHYHLLHLGDVAQPHVLPVVNHQDSPVLVPTSVAATSPQPLQVINFPASPVSVSNLEPGITNGVNHLQDLVLPKENHPGIITVTPTVPTVTAIDLANLSQTLLTIVSDKTGYPTSMLELSMDIEADLGIDSIKRVEILGGLLELYPDLPKPNPEELAQLRTLGQIVEYMQTLAPKEPVAQPISTDLEFKTQPISTDLELKTQPISTDLEFKTQPISTDSTQATPLDTRSIQHSLLNIVCDKTGYPTSMLELSMDIEADLGIDSIKRVEILGGLLELYPDLPKPNPEELAQLRTLGQIVEYMQTLAPKDIPTDLTLNTEAGLDSATVTALSTHQIRRSPVRLKALPEPDVLDVTIPPQHIALVTDDGSPTTGELAVALTGRGWKTVVLSFPRTLVEQQLPLAEGIQRVVLADLSEEHLQQQLEAIAHKYGAIAAFIHLNPVSDVCYLETEKALLRHVFLIAKYLKEPLNQAATKGRSCFLTVAHLDGQFGLGRTTNFGAIGAGLFGLTKSLNLEWEDVFCRSLDLSPDLGTPAAVESILAELYDPNRLVTEVGYSSQGRVTLVAETLPPSPIIAPSVPNTKLQSQVFLVSGGGKGITAQCVIKLAEQYQCKFILLGRSSTEPEPVWAEDCDTEAQLKQRIMEDFLAKGEKPTPVMVQKKYQAISSQREIQATIRAIEQVGGQGEYVSVDVTDAIALQEQLAGVIERWGAVTGIIHGAGNLADKLIEKKSVQDFETVYAAKVKGLENLLHCVPASQLQYLVLFSSVVGFYGNVGQSDYAIANEILNKSAHLIKRNHPDCHVVAINWGPWDSGMVSPELKKAFAERNIETIPIEVGTQMLVNELAISNQEFVQLVIGSPILYRPPLLANGFKTFRIQRKLTLLSNPFLQDHVIAGNAVLPATCALAWIINTCEQLYPGYTFFICPNYKVLKGIVFDENLASEYTLDLQEIAKIEDDKIEFEAKIWSKYSGDKTRYHFSTHVKLKRQIPSVPIYEQLNLNQDQNLLSTKSFYQNGTGSLFHGVTFQGVKALLNASPGKLTIECLLPNPGEKQQGQFPLQTFNPYIADVQVHALWMWTHHFYQQVCLPSEIKAFEQFAPIPFGETFYVSCEVKSKTESAVVADVIAHDQQGKIYNRMIGAKATILPKQL